MILPIPDQRLRIQAFWSQDTLDVEFYWQHHAYSNKRRDVLVSFIVRVESEVLLHAGTKNKFKASECHLAVCTRYCSLLCTILHKVYVGTMYLLLSPSPLAAATAAAKATALVIIIPPTPLYACIIILCERVKINWL